MRRHRMQIIFLISVLEKTPARKLPKYTYGGSEAGGVYLPVNKFCSLGAKMKFYRIPVNRNIGLKKRRGASCAAQPRVLLAARSDGAARDELDNGREC